MKIRQKEKAKEENTERKNEEKKEERSGYSLGGLAALLATMPSK